MNNYLYQTNSKKAAEIINDGVIPCLYELRDSILHGDKHRAEQNLCAIREHMNSGFTEDLKRLICIGIYTVFAHKLKNVDMYMLMPWYGFTAEQIFDKLCALADMCCD